jgi:hypothetical protein
MDQFAATRRSAWELYNASAQTTTNAAPTLADVVIASLPATAKKVAPSVQSHTPNLMEFLPYGIGTAAQTLDLRVIGWSLDPTGLRYVERVLARVTATLSAVVLAGTTNKTCNTIAITEGDDGIDVRECSNAAGFATFIVDMKGSDYWSIDGNRGSATSFNLFHRPF